MKTSTVLQILDRYAEEHGHYFSLCFEGYAEPGYSDPEAGVIAFGNWNPKSFDRPIPKADQTMPRISAVLGKLGAEVEWNDEWTTCTDCGKAVRTQPNSYSWSRSYWEDEGELVCELCALEDPEPILEALEGNDRSCLTLGIDPAEHGYVHLEGDFQNGLHYGMDADPKVIGKSLRELGVERFLFSLDYASQFDIGFSVWIHRDEFPSLDKGKWQDADKDGPSVAGACERALRDASRKMAELPDDGRIKVASCQADGTAKVGLATREEFIDGKVMDCVK